MSEILEKLSSYNLFNYLFPGALFVALSGQVSTRDFTQDDILIALFTYYFIGLVISRFGSLLLEPFLKKIKFLNFANYNSYLSALEKDKKINELSEANNMYRTLCSLFICLLGLIALDSIVAKFPEVESIISHIGIITLLILFLFSYRKQTNYINKRVQASK